MTCCRSTLVLCLAVFGCTDRDEPVASATQGVAEVRVDTASFQTSNITRVSVESTGHSQDLVLNAASGTFDGTIFLPSGTQDLVARAFSGDTQVGVSRPTSVEVRPGEVVRVVVKILDTTDDAPQVFGPIVDSFTHPTKTEAGSSVTFAISVVAPINDPVTYDWTSDCQDASFSAPHAATTSWSKPTQGTCQITVAATSNGIVARETFVIVVFPTGAGNGGVEVNGVFVTAPVLHLDLPGVNCSISPGFNASCPSTLTSPGSTGYGVSVLSWGLSDSGTIEVFDNCGGQFASFGRINDFIQGFWLPPVNAGVCLVTARAVNGDGIASQLSAAVVIHAGSPQPVAQPPDVAVFLNSNGCLFRASDVVSPAECGFVFGTGMTVFGDFTFANGFPGSAVLTDDCGGGTFVPTFLNTSFFRTWDFTRPSGTICTISLRVTNFQGTVAEAKAHYQLF